MELYFGAYVSYQHSVVERNRRKFLGQKQFAVLGTILTCLGFLAPANRGALMTCAVVLRFLLGMPAGYMAAKMHNRSSAAISSGTALRMLETWFGISVPLKLFGAYLGHRKKDFHGWWRAFLTSGLTVVYLLSLLLHRTSNHRYCKHHFVHWVHHDAGADFLLFDRDEWIFVLLLVYFYNLHCGESALKNFSQCSQAHHPCF
ncbi:PREDICTED: uncharacterized protein LOC102009953 [Chinchilla lanigera]|uniref:uncharacterized protein LOC102009953 n=1 Tax=Chinchilla lanigera TaxID=34839 RepID=UPI0006968588|nr:PREDICTED: uncharacterized protein LOC102009953 [Chinchilla lanigera]